MTFGAKFAVSAQDTAFSLPRNPPVREAFSPVLRHSGRRGVQERTAARHGDIGTPRRLDLLLSVLLLVAILTASQPGT